jgi:hypothetical protein
MAESRLPPADVAVLAALNPSVCTQQVRVAQACSDLGLRVEYLVDDLHGPAEETAALYGLDLDRARVVHGDTWRSGPLAYPSAPALLRLQRGLHRVLRDYRPRVVLTHTDAGGIWRALHAWAKTHGVVGAVLQEGVTARRRPGFTPGPRNPLRLLASRLLRSIGPSVLSHRFRMYEYADHVLVWGDAMRRQLLASRRVAATIHVVGSPAFDDVSRRGDLAPAEPRVVLFAQQPQPNSEVEMDACRQIVSVCANRLECRLLFRPHPRGGLRRETIRALAAATSHPELVEVVEEGDVVDHLDRASVLLTYYSTSAYHAAVHGLPVVLADWVSSMHELDAPSFGAALSVKTAADLEPILRQALDDPASRRRMYDGGESWLADHLGPLDGGAARRVARVIAELGLAGFGPAGAGPEGAGRW